MPRRKSVKRVANSVAPNDGTKWGHLSDADLLKEMGREALARLEISEAAGERPVVPAGVGFVHPAAAQVLQCWGATQSVILASSTFRVSA